MGYLCDKCLGCNRLEDSLFKGVYGCVNFRSGDSNEAICKEVLQLKGMETMQSIVHQQSVWNM